jgi:hypothetical protein
MKTRLLFGSAAFCLTLCTSLARADGPKFQQFTVVREFGTGDTSAIFGVLPSEAGYKITDVTGPMFLGHAQVAILNENTLSQFFDHSVFPMTATEKQQLLSKYNGAYVVYFEKYSDQLCSGDEFEIAITGSLGNTTATSQFSFVAQPQNKGDCKFLTLSEITMTSS